MGDFLPRHKHLEPKFIRECDGRNFLPWLTSEPSKDEVMEFINSVGGFIELDECSVLYDLAKSCSGVIVEVGSWKGRSTVALGHGAKASGSNLVFAIDHHVGSEEMLRSLGGRTWTFDAFVNNIERACLTDIVIPLVMNSWYGARVLCRPLDFVFIDGAHEEEDVEQDVFLWSYKIKKGGMLAMHDVLGFESVSRVWDRCIVESGYFEVIGIERNLGWARKIKDIEYNPVGGYFPS